VTRTLAILAGVPLSCSHTARPEDRALMQRGDCAELLLAAARARDERKRSFDQVTTGTSTTVEDAAP